MEQKRTPRRSTKTSTEKSEFTETSTEKSEFTDITKMAGDLWQWVQRATATKIAVGLAGVAVMLMGYFGLDSRVSDLEGLDKRVRKALTQQRAIEKDQDQLGKYIRNQIEKGIAKGVRMVDQPGPKR